MGHSFPAASQPRQSRLPTFGEAVEEKPPSIQLPLQQLPAPQTLDVGIGGATPKLAQVNAATPQTNQSTVMVAFNSAQTAGNLNVIAVGWNDTTSSVSSVTDSNGNTYALAVGPSTGPNLSQSIYYAANIKGGSNTVTVTFNQAAVSVDVRVMEYSGVSTTSPLDVTAVGSGTSNGGNVATANATTNDANELIVGAGMTGWAFNAPGSGFTKDIITSPDSDIAEHEDVTAVGSYNASASLTSHTNTTWLMQMATFKAATTSGTSMYADVSYAPFGEAYAQIGTTDLSFTGQNQDTASGLYDFTAREFHGAAQGRWISPDPAGLAAVDPMNPQTWNRYAYVVNSPLSTVDPSGLKGWQEFCPIDYCQDSGGVGSGAGNDEFDAIEGAPGTYTSIDMYGNFTWGFSVDQWRAYYAAQSTVQYYFTGGNGSVLEQQTELAAIQFGQRACAGQDVSGMLSCIQQVYDQLALQTNPDMQGGNYDFRYADQNGNPIIQVNGQFVNPSDFGCAFSRCGIFDSLDYSHGNGTFHVDTANPDFFPLGPLVHFGWDVVGGNTVWSAAGIPRPWW